MGLDLKTVFLIEQDHSTGRVGVQSESWLRRQSEDQYQAIAWLKKGISAMFYSSSHVLYSKIIILETSVRRHRNSSMNKFIYGNVQKKIYQMKSALFFGISHLNFQHCLFLPGVRSKCLDQWEVLLAKQLYLLQKYSD